MIKVFHNSTKLGNYGLEAFLIPGKIKKKISLVQNMTLIKSEMDNSTLSRK